ncbi:DUF4241 domain-containing protein [Nocardiopsis sp. NPDC049922]|uniref:DUF4241 domain-containing protein n=1 Tax=Nocardiopsis sp. NPDC049922 TaxID=3155157 RepID=UPI0033D631F3
MTSPVTCEIVYCEGWDPAVGGPVGQLSPETARDRDTAGEQYAVLIRKPEGAPLVLLEIAWSHDHCGVWLFDEARERRTHHRYARREHGGLSLTRSRSWPADGERGSRSPRLTIELIDEDAGRYEYQYEHEDGGATHVPQGLEADLAPFATCPAPAFGHWHDLLEVHPRLTGVDLELREAPADPDPTPVPPPWSPPGPMAPAFVDALFRPDGRRYRDGWTGMTGTVEVRDLGTVSLPTGQVLAYDPGSLRFAKPEDALTVSLPPGEHPVRISLLRFEDGPAVVAGLRIDVADPARTPVTRWELGLRSGQDPRDLDEGEFYGVGVDGGMIGVCDVACLPHFTELFDDFNRYTWLIHELTPDRVAELQARESGLKYRARRFLDFPRNVERMQNFARSIGLDYDWERGDELPDLSLLARVAHGIVHTTDPSLALDTHEAVQVTSSWSRTLTDPTTGGHLVVADSGHGDGDYPVWIGRTEEGEVAALVVDMLVLHDAEPVAG